MTKHRKIALRHNKLNKKRRRKQLKRTRRFASKSKTFSPKNKLPLNLQQLLSYKPDGTSSVDKQPTPESVDSGKGYL